MTPDSQPLSDRPRREDPTARALRLAREEWTAPLIHEITRLRAEVENHERCYHALVEKAAALKAENDLLRAGISWCRGMCSDREDHADIDRTLGEILSGESTTSDRPRCERCDGEVVNAERHGGGWCIESADENDDQEPSA